LSRLTIGCNGRRFAPPLQPKRYKRGRVITVIVNSVWYGPMPMKQRQK
jgi:hypothetical protein